MHLHVIESILIQHRLCDTYHDKVVTSNEQWPHRITDFAFIYYNHTIKRIRNQNKTVYYCLY